VTISRRRHLQGLASLSIGALTTAACGRDTGSGDKTAAPAAAATPPPQPAAAGQASPFSLHFMGLHVFGLAEKSAIASMPKAGSSEEHSPFLVVLGGRLESSVSDLTQVAEGPFGINAHGFPLLGYALGLKDGGGSLAISDAPVASAACGPVSADDWSSMQYVVDLKKVYPDAAPQDDWNTNRAAAAVHMQRGTLKAMPGGVAFKAPGKWVTKAGTVKHQQFMTGAAVWTFDAPSPVQFTLTPLPGAASPRPAGTLSIVRDTTGPLLCAVVYIPTTPSANGPSHVHISYKLFKGIPAESAPEYASLKVEDPPTECASKTPAPKLAAASKGSQAALVQALLHILNDGSVQCPPSSFRS